MHDEEIMMEYIRQEPDIIAELVTQRKTLCKDFVAHFAANPVKRVYFSAHGSPYYASQVIKLAMESLLQVEASSDIATVFNNHSGFNQSGVYQPNEMLLICPGHSGRTIGPIHAARRAVELGIPVICTTLNSSGELAKLSTVVIHKTTGDEESYPESKGHVATITILLLCVLETALALGRMPQEIYDTYIEAFTRLPDACRDAIDKTLVWYEKHKYLLIKEPFIAMVGYGANYHTAQEGALKMLEATLKPCAGYECEEYMHGQLEPLQQNTPVFFLCPWETEQKRMHELLTWCRRHSGSCFLIGSEDNPLRDELSLCCNFTNHPFLSAIEYTIPFQVICHRMARDIGLSTVVSFHDGSSAELSTKT